MKIPAYLVLADGSYYQGLTFGAERDTIGEVVFCTSMNGYQEMLTDPSYAGQILVPTYPLIGNYGVNEIDHESAVVQVKGFVVREICEIPNHYLKQSTIADYLSTNNIPGLFGVDTRAITRKIRATGAMMGMITSRPLEEAIRILQQSPAYGSIDYVGQVTTRHVYSMPSEIEPPLRHVVVVDCGTKFNIIRLLNRAGCRVTVVPALTRAPEIMALEPDGILLSPGPGDPALLDDIVATAQSLVQFKPLMGICLGAQIIARAFGARTFKLKYGHRGGNHPVRDQRTGKVYITAQNHGYAIDPETLKNGLEVTHVNLHDDTVEGIAHRELPVFAIQYHSEASPGPLDNTYLFDRFMEMIENNKN